MMIISTSLSLNVHLKTLQWLDFETSFSSVVGKQDNGDYLPFVPAHKLRFELRCEKEKLLFFRKAFISVNICTAFNQNNAALDETTTLGYTLIDLSIGGKIKMKQQFILISVSANNVLDTKYIDHLSTLKEVNLYNPGRNISLNLKLPFVVIMNDNN